MQFVKCPVATYCIGQAASMGAILLAAGTQGKRYALSNARIMIHQPWGGAQGTASDISIQAEEIIRLKKRLNEILSTHSGKSYDEITQADRPGLLHVRGRSQDHGPRRPRRRLREEVTPK